MLLRAAGATEQLQNETRDALDGIKAGDVFHQDDELVVMGARHEVGCTEDRRQHLRGVRDDGIARLAAEHVVDVVERVVVDEEQRMGAVLIGAIQKIVRQMRDGFVGVKACCGKDGNRRHRSSPQRRGDEERGPQGAVVRNRQKAARGDEEHALLLPFGAPKRTAVARSRMAPFKFEAPPIRSNLNAI